MLKAEYFVTYSFFGKQLIKINSTNGRSCCSLECDNYSGTVVV